MKRLLLLYPAVLLAALLAPSPVLAQSVDLTGEWTFEVSTSQGSGSPAFVFKQEGEKLSGTYRGLLGEAELTGTVSGRRLKFSFTGSVQGTELTVTYDGEAESNDSVKGAVDLGGLASGTFTGKRKK